MHGRIFAFIGAKGGVGTTTMAVNVATALAKARAERTLLIDLNVACGDAAVFLGAEPRFSVADALENMQRLDDAFFKSLVVRSKTPACTCWPRRSGPSAQFDAARIATLLDFASDAHRYTVLDVPRSEAAVLDALDGVDKIVLVVNQELATVRNAGRMAAHAAAALRPGPRCRLVHQPDRPQAEIGARRRRADGRHRQSRTRSRATTALALQAMNKGRPIVLDTRTTSWRRRSQSMALRSGRHARRKSGRGAAERRPLRAIAEAVQAERQLGG